MRTLGVLSFLLVAASAVQAQGAAKSPTCHAVRKGQDLITRIEFPDGYSVEGPWHVKSLISAGSGSTLTAVLDHIVESRPFTTGGPQTTALPAAIEISFKGSNMDRILNEAADLWCMTVLRARPLSPSMSAPDENALGLKIT
jgi:hypothetical protein